MSPDRFDDRAPDLFFGRRLPTTAASHHPLGSTSRDRGSKPAKSIHAMTFHDEMAVAFMDASGSLWTKQPQLEARCSATRASTSTSISGSRASSSNRAGRSRTISRRLPVSPSLDLMTLLTRGSIDSHEYSRLGQLARVSLRGRRCVAPRCCLGVYHKHRLPTIDC